MFLLFFLYLLVDFSIGRDVFLGLKKYLDDEQKYLIRKYFFPYKHIKRQKKDLEILEKKLNNLQDNQVRLYDPINFNKLELDFKKQNKDILTFFDNQKSIKLDNKLILKKIKFKEGFYSGIANIFPGSGYIDFNDDNLFVLSARGILAYSEMDKFKFKLIKNNINQFIGIDQFNKARGISLKDLHIFEKNIFVSLTEEIKNDCWNTSVLKGEINYININFDKIFSSKSCVHSHGYKENLDNEFEIQQSGGRIQSIDSNIIFLSVGDYRSRYLAQDRQSINGKIIKININDSSYEIVSMGHRNPQGLYYDSENNFILETEHGPKGGDEINLIDLNEDNKIIPNYGWAISSYGGHYNSETGRGVPVYSKYPLYKSHKKYGFIEPLKSFQPSIGISEIVKIGKTTYAVSSLRDKSIYLFELNNKKISSIQRIEVKERVRDLNYYKNKIYLFLEDSASIGIVSFN